MLKLNCFQQKWICYYQQNWLADEIKFKKKKIERNQWKENRRTKYSMRQFKMIDFSGKRNAIL